MSIHPGEGVALIVLTMENALLQSAESPWIPGPPHRESVDGDTVEAREAARVLITPRQVVGRAGGYDDDLMLARELSCDQPCVELGAARDLRAVPLNNESEAQLLSNACR